ncbi:MAG TPA: hypothetical protein VHE61_03565 [Opitutaceae bacterium]|nr:hypothetical protein [Opitutaceae bacterium]
MWRRRAHYPSVVIWLVLSVVAPSLHAVPTPAEIGEQVNHFLQAGRDVHVVQTEFLLDGGSAEVVLADAAGDEAHVILFNRRRATREGVMLVAADARGEREDLVKGDGEAALRSALIAALRRSHVTNPDSRILLGTLTSWLPTYGDEIRWSSQRRVGYVDTATLVKADLPLALGVILAGIGCLVALRRFRANKR